MSESTFWLVVLIGAVVLLGALVWLYRLIMHPPLAAEPDPDEFVTILSGLGELEAQVFRTKLSAFGVTSELRHHGVPHASIVATAGWEVRVRYCERFEAERCLGERLLTSEPEPGEFESAER